MELLRKKICCTHLINTKTEDIELLPTTDYYIIFFCYRSGDGELLEKKTVIKYKYDKGTVGLKTEENNGSNKISVIIPYHSINVK